MIKLLMIGKKIKSLKRNFSFSNTKKTIGRYILLIGLFGILSINNSCRSKKGCPGVHYYTTPQVFKDKKMGLVNKTPSYNSSGGMRDSKIVNKNGTGAWSKKNKAKDKRKAKSGIIPPHLKKPPHSKVKAKKSQKTVKPKK